MSSHRGRAEMPGPAHEEARCQPFMRGVPLPVVRNVVGHSRASVTLDVYSHALLDEPRSVLAERRELVLEREERDPRDASVMPRSDDQHPETLTENMEDTGIEPVTSCLQSRRSPI